MEPIEDQEIEDDVDEDVVDEEEMWTTPTLPVIPIPPDLPKLENLAWKNAFMSCDCCHDCTPSV